jgi:hypothetical protein
MELGSSGLSDFGAIYPSVDFWLSTVAAHVPFLLLIILNSSISGQVLDETGILDRHGIVQIRIHMLAQARIFDICKENQINGHTYMRILSVFSPNIGCS